MQSQSVVTPTCRSSTPFLKLNIMANFSILVFLRWFLVLKRGHCYRPVYKTVDVLKPIIHICLIFPSLQFGTRNHLPDAAWAAFPSNSARQWSVPGGMWWRSTPDTQPEERPNNDTAYTQLLTLRGEGGGGVRWNYKLLLHSGLISTSWCVLKTLI